MLRWRNKLKAGKTLVFAVVVFMKGGNDLKDENDTPNPLTAYAKSKVMTEEKLDLIADSNIVTSLDCYCMWILRTFEIGFSIKFVVCSSFEK